MKYIILPPDGYETPEDFKLYDRPEDALEAIQEMDESIENTESYKVASIAAEYKVVVNLSTTDSIGGQEFQIVDEDGDELCEVKRTTPSSMVSHFKDGHGEGVSLSEIGDYYISNLDDSVVQLTYRLAFRRPGSLYAIDSSDKASMPAPTSSNKPNEIILGDN